jgi:hypothetical protein
MTKKTIYRIEADEIKEFQWLIQILETNPAIKREGKPFSIENGKALHYQIMVEWNN